MKGHPYHAFRHFGGHVSLYIHFAATGFYPDLLAVGDTDPIRIDKGNIGGLLTQKIVEPFATAGLGKRVVMVQPPPGAEHQEGTPHLALQPGVSIRPG